MQCNDRSNLYIMMDERQSIKDSLRCLRKYGSTSTNNHCKFPDEFIKHMVGDRDTLQGIALKYGVTTEQIRRANRLWANDSLFLRESLLIPVKSKSLPSTSMPSFESPTESDLFLNQSLDEVKRLQNGIHKTESIPSSSSSYKNDDDLDNANDFLNRIDADIANKTQQVKLTQDKSLYVFGDTVELTDSGGIVGVSGFMLGYLVVTANKVDEFDHNGILNCCRFAPNYGDSTVRRKPAMSRLKQQQQRQTGCDQNTFEMPSVVTQSKKVRNSLQRLQEKQEEMFEL